jgi:hypothetical protein
MGLADLLSETSVRTGSGSLVEIIEKQFAREGKKPPLTNTSYVRASSVPNLCPREEVLCALEGITRPDDVDAGLNLTFLHGTALHWAVQNQLLGPMGVLYGTWKCERCTALYGEQREGRAEDWAVPMPKECKCGAREFTYKEASFVDHDLRMTGHSDGFLVIPGLPGMGILEVKSIGSRYAKEIKVAPQIAHMIQAHVYMMFTGFRWAKILYWQKGEAGLGSLVEHHIDRDEETIRRVQDTIRSIWAGVALKTLPERICATDSCSKAKACPVSTKCFAA